jgi:hypothetical protein
MRIILQYPYTTFDTIFRAHSNKWLPQRVRHSCIVSSIALNGRRSRTRLSYYVVITDRFGHVIILQDLHLNLPDPTRDFSGVGVPPGTQNTPGLHEEAELNNIVL